MPATPPSGARLPGVLNPFVGRNRELEQILELLPSARLLTLTGPGGSGKTRLASEVARRLQPHDAGSVLWVELAPLVNADLVAQHVAAQLQVKEQTARSTIDVLAERLREMRWLVLDNCEHVIDAAAPFVQALLQRCERLTVLATSREALGIDGERAWLLRGLSTEATGDGAQGSEAMRFFVDRARAVKQSFEVTASNSAAIEQICRRLDGMPLALELAAARVTVLNPEQIAERLDDAFRLLVSDRRAVLPRHRSLSAAVEWSYRLISPLEQALLQRLAVFAGSFSLEAAEHVCSGEDIPPGDVLVLLSGLVKRSLVNVHDETDAARYSLLEIIRQFAQEQRLLDSSTSTSGLAAKHAAYFAALTETALPFLEESHSQIWEAKLTAEYADIRAALHWAFRGGDVRVGHRMVSALWWYWGMNWRIAEWRYWMGEALQAGTVGESSSWGGVLNGGGTLAYIQGDIDRGRALLQQAGDVLARTGDLAHESLARATLCHLLWNDDQVDAALEQGKRAAAIARALPHVWPLCHAMADALGPLHVERGELELAEACFQEAAAKANRPGVPWCSALVARGLAALALDRQRTDEAPRHVLSALSHIRSITDPHTTFRILHVLGRTLETLNEFDDAARLLGTMTSAIEGGMPLLRNERIEHERLRQVVRDTLGEEMFELRHSQGHRETVETALSRGYETLSRLAGATPDAPVTPAVPSLHVRALGSFKATLGSEPRLAGTRNARAIELLVYLICHPDGRTREQIGVALWPEASTAQVKNSFHVLLHKLRRSLGDDGLVVLQGDRYGLSATLPVWFDAFEFERQMEKASRRSAGPAEIEAALELYRGAFMEGESIGDWASGFRERLQGLYLEGLSALADAQIVAGDLAGAASTLERLVRADDLREEAFRRLMTCLDGIGLRDQALRHYRRLVERLRSELGVEPERETRALASQLQKPRTA